MTDSELMTVVQGMTLGQVSEMRGWLEDCDIDVDDDVTIYYVATVIQKYYDGGIREFATNTTGL